jgi:hypothetical protein
VEATTLRRSRRGWFAWIEAAWVLTFRPHLKKTLGIAILVGTVFFAMNQLPAVLAGQVTLVVVLKAALSYVVPFCVSNSGLLAASREIKQPKEEST